MLFKKSKKIDDGRSIYVKKSRMQEIWHQFQKNKGAVVGLAWLGHGRPCGGRRLPVRVLSGGKIGQRRSSQQPDPHLQRFFIGNEAAVVDALARLAGPSAAQMIVKPGDFFRKAGEILAAHFGELLDVDVFAAEHPGGRADD